jgi:serine/threonine-protein kinase
MADVYCAHDEHLGRDVALKVLHRRFAQDNEFVERFRREASAAAGLQHPNVVNVFDRGQYDGTYYIAMEFLRGRTLKELIQQEAPLDQARALDIAVQILRAAGFGHKRGVIHRDFKPQNVIIDDEDRVKVTDFGIARAGASEITQTGSIMGTVQYLSPEQAQGQAVGPRSDLYSIGILLYELLTGQVPFHGDSPVAIALKQISEPPPAPSAINPAVSPQLDAIVQRAMSKDPDERFASAEEMMAALAAERTRIRTGGGPGQTAEFALAAAGVAVAAGDPEADAPLPVASPAGDGYVEEVYYGTEPPPLAPQPRRVWPWVVLAALVLAAIAAGLVLALSPARRTVPNVVGQQEPIAAAALQNAGFTPVPTQVADPEGQGTVISQSPAGGVKASKGALVQLTVSAGPGTRSVPDVTGRGVGAATRELVRDGFNVIRTNVQSQTVPRDHVIATSPGAFTQAQPGQTITLEVSSGAGETAVPDVTGQSAGNATTILEAAGFKVARTHQESTQPAGTVLSQSPAAGGNAPTGSIVVLTVARAPAQVTVPALTGQSGVDAVVALEAAGLRPLTKSQPVANPAQDGIVLSQTPAANAKVRRGSPVHLVIGHLAISTGPTGTSAGSTGATTALPTQTPAAATTPAHTQPSTQ